MQKTLAKLLRRVPEPVLVSGATIVAFGVWVVISIWVDSLAPAPLPEGARQRLGDGDAWHLTDEGER